MGINLADIGPDQDVYILSEKYKFNLIGNFEKLGESGKCALFTILSKFEVMPDSKTLATSNKKFEYGKSYWFGEKEIIFVSKTKPLERYVNTV